ncbi:MAG: hypothetical protein Q8868_15295, partial [Bacteroidota bacterium]|nr:hypothetical protein [Bacteroidota bacterium]
IFNTDSVPKVEYKSELYNKATHVFHFHSWVPLGIDFENISASPGITFLSQNLLGTAVTTGGYIYNRNQRTGKSFITMAVETRYPAFDMHIDYGGRRDSIVKNVSEPLLAKWQELNIQADVRLPLKWTHTFWLRTFQPSIGLSWKSLKMKEEIPVSFNHNNILAVDYSLTATNMMKVSLRDIYPCWAQQLEIKFSSTLSGKERNRIFSGQAFLDFPGFSKHHGFRLYGSYQKKTENYYTFTDDIIFPRGYSEIFRDEITSLSALYTMPWGYPDWQLKHILYIKRIKTSWFFDYARSFGNLLPNVFSSEGVDLTMEFTLFNFIAPFDAGLRTAYLNEEGNLKFQFLFAINLNSLY